MAVLPGFTLLGRFSDINFVAVLETRLKDANIEYVLLDEARASWSGFMAYGQYGVRLLVRDDQLQDARLLLE